MSGSGGLAPFDRHPADGGGLAQVGANLADQAAQAIDQSRLSLLAFQPAPQNWDGIAAPALRAAPQPVRQRAYAVSSALSWASVAVNYWASRIISFNQRVDQITAGLADGRSRIQADTNSAVPGTPEQIAGALQALEAQARKLWWLAYNADIVDGARTAASMLRSGPTSANVTAAVQVGLLPPGQRYTPLTPIQLSGLGPFDIPFPLMPLGECSPDDEYPNLFLDGAADGAGVANAVQLPFKEGLMEMLGGAAGDVGVDAVNEDTGGCTHPIDLPQPPEPPQPPDPPGFLENTWNDFNDAVDDVGEAIDDFGQQLPDSPPPPFGPGPGGGPMPLPVPP